MEQNNFSETHIVSPKRSWIDIIFWIFITFAIIILGIIFLIEIFFWSVSKEYNPINTTPRTISDTTTKDLICNTDITTWKQYTYTRGELTFSFKYPSCWREVPPVVGESDDYRVYRVFVSTNQDSPKYPKELLFFVQIGAAMNPTIQSTSKDITPITMSGYPAKKTLYKDTVAGKANLIVQTDKIFSFKLGNYIDPDKMPVGIKVDFSLNDPNDYSKILDLIVSSLKINL